LEDSAVSLGGSTLVAATTVIGGLIGTISILFRSLIASKDSEIAVLKERIDSINKERMSREESLTKERDYFRDIAFDLRDDRRKQQQQVPRRQERSV